MPDSVRFTETMSGRLAPRPDLPHAAAAALGDAALFTLTVVCPDVDAMVADADRRSPAFGVVLLDGRPLAVERGHLDLFVDAPAGVEMRYGLDLRAMDGRALTLRGTKFVRRRGLFPTMLTDTTTLFVDILEGETPRLRGVLTMGPGAVLMQGLSFRGSLRGIARYLAYYVRRAWSVYTGPKTG